MSKERPDQPPLRGPSLTARQRASYTYFTNPGGSPIRLRDLSRETLEWAFFTLLAEEKWRDKALTRIAHYLEDILP